MNWKKQKLKWIDDFIEETKLEDDDEIDMELLVEWLAKKHCNKAENLPISDVRLSLPTNADIVDEADFRHSDGERHSSFISGARWMRSLIASMNRKLQGSEA